MRPKVSFQCKMEWLFNLNSTRRKLTEWVTRPLLGSGALAKASLQGLWKSINPASFHWLCLGFHKSLHRLHIVYTLSYCYRQVNLRSSKSRCTILPNHIQSLSANRPVIITWQVAEYTMTLSIWRDLHMTTELQMRCLKAWRSERMLRTSLCPAVANVLIPAQGGWTTAVPLNANEWCLQRSCIPPNILHCFFFAPYAKALTCAITELMQEVFAQQAFSKIAEW